MHAPIKAEPMGLPALRLALALVRQQNLAVTEPDRKVLRLRALPYVLADRLAGMQDSEEIAKLLLSEINSALDVPESFAATL